MQTILGANGIIVGRKINYLKLNGWMINLLSLLNANLKETKELLPRYAIDNIFDSTKFKRRFPEFRVTNYENGIKEIIKDYKIK